MTAGDPDSQPFWEGVRAGELRLPSCDACGQPHFPPMPACPGCGATTLTWARFDGDGQVYSWVRVHRALSGEPAWELPYTIAVVQLRAGPRVLAVAADIAGTVRIGDPVRVEPVAGPLRPHLRLRPEEGAA